MSLLETHVGSRGWEELYDLFLEMDFKSMTKEKTWNNFVKTFSRLGGV